MSGASCPARKNKTTFYSQREVEVSKTFFDYVASGMSIRSDLSDSFNVYWRQLSAAGTWFSAIERVAIAAESRAAFDCALCLRRKTALSPNSITGEHTAATDLPTIMVEAIHKVVTDQALSLIHI